MVVEVADRRVEERKRTTVMSKLVMVIDDSLIVRKIIETSLRREGFEYVSYPDGIEALRALAEGRQKIPDLVILDVGLPKMDGYEIARRMKTKPHLANTVIIMLSGRDGVIDRLKGRLAGAKDYITKPFKTQEVISTIYSYLGVPTYS
jgi:twitching motility two-component system response regulator PilG